MPLGSMGGTPDERSVIFQTDKTGTNDDSSILAMALWNPDGSSYATVNAINVICRGICFRTYPNPAISAVDFGLAGNCVLSECLIDTGEDYPNATQPTHTGTFGLRLPRVNNSQGPIRTQNVAVGGYGVGVIASEFWCSDFTSAGGCLTGVRLTQSNFINYGRILIYWCPTGIEIVGE